MKRRNFLGGLTAVAVTGFAEVKGVTPSALPRGNFSGAPIVGESLWEIDYRTKEIRFVGPEGGPRASVLDLHRWLHCTFEEEAGGEDYLNPSDRLTDEFIELKNGYHITDKTAQYLEAGSIKQEGALYMGNIDLRAKTNSFQARE